MYAVIHAITARSFLRGQLAFMAKNGFDVSVVSGGDPAELTALALREGVRSLLVPMQREMSPGADALSLSAMTRALWALEPDIVNASTPKAGLLGMMAARALGVRSRLYLLRGLRLETERGARRAILSTTERVASTCATEVVCVSRSLSEVAVSGGFVSARKARVLGDGASNGVDAERFSLRDEVIARATALRTELGIPEGAPVVGFIGRLVADKGIDELARAMEIVREHVPRARLLLVGADFAGDDVDPAAQRLKTHSGSVVVGSVDDTAPYYALMDILAFPSKREGFPNVPLEAAACERPVVGFRATGVVDAVASGVTGELVATNDVEALAAALVRYLRDPALRRAHGEAGRARVLASFTNERVWSAWAEHYRALVA